MVGDLGVLATGSDDDECDADEYDGEEGGEEGVEKGGEEGSEEGSEEEGGEEVVVLEADEDEPGEIARLRSNVAELEGKLADRERKLAEALAQIRRLEAAQAAHVIQAPSRPQSLQAQADATAQSAKGPGWDEAPKPHPLTDAVARAKARSAERAKATVQAKAEEANGTMGLAPAALAPMARMADEFTEGNPQTPGTTDSTAADNFTFSDAAAAIAMAAAHRLHRIARLSGDR